MKILLVTNNFPPLIGGVPTVYGNLCRLLSPEISVLTAWRNHNDSKEYPGWREFDASTGYAIHRLELLSAARRADGTKLGRYSEDLRTRGKVAAAFLKLLERMNPDVVCIGSMGLMYWLCHCGRVWKRAPFICYTHGEEINVSHARRKRLRSLKSAAGIIAVSSFTRGELTRQGIDPEKIITIPNGVDLSRFTPGPKDRGLVERFGLEGKRVLMTLARLDPRKGHDMVVRSLPGILEAVPNAVYLIVGDGPHRSALQALARQQGVADRVRFAGSVAEEDLVRFYRTCDVFLMPNRTLENGDTEGFGLVFLEAAACGRPVVGGKAGGVPDAVDDGVTGRLVDGTSVEEITTATIRLLSDPRLCDEWGANGLRRAQQYSWVNVAARFREVCGRMAGLRIQ